MLESKDYLLKNGPSSWSFTAVGIILDLINAWASYMLEWKYFLLMELKSGLHCHRNNSRLHKCASYVLESKDYLLMSLHCSASMPENNISLYMMVS